MPEPVLAWATCPWCGMTNVLVLDGALVGHSKDATYGDVVIGARLGVWDALMCDGGGLPVVENCGSDDG
jgi:hypothetical protein